MKISLPEIQKTDLVKSVESLLLAKHTPACVVIDDKINIIHIHGYVAPFLEISQGKPTFNLLKMAREGLKFELRNAVHKVKETDQPIIKERISIFYNAKKISVTIEVIPVKDDSKESRFLILFYKTVADDQEEEINSHLTIEEIKADKNLLRIRQLEEELEQTIQDVNKIIEGQEVFNEAMGIANEKLLKSGEDLQFANEELETSKEELQMGNEELININEELLNTQEMINISRNYTEAIVDTLREPIVVLDNNLRIKNISRAFSKKYTITKEEAEGKLIYEIQNHIFDNVHMRSMLEKILPQKAQLDDYQIQINLQPYGESTMLLNARQVTNDESKEPLILLAIEDITERRIIEKRLQALSDGFEAKVKERTSDLEKSNLELGSLVKELHQANTQLQQFAYIASHDLQEPLRKILMFTSRLKEQHAQMPQEAINVLDKITKSSDRMKTLVQDLLEFSYLNNHEKLFAPTNLNLILKNILTDFELLIEQKNVKIKSNLLPVISAMPLQMNQLFYNLMSNALKFCASGDPVITINSRKLTLKQINKYPGLNPEMGYYEIIFKDNGIGFDQEYEKQIFTIFQRLHSKDAYVGTGIGLAISKKIIENHEGIIFAKSKKEEGAAFHIILPVSRKD